MTSSTRSAAGNLWRYKALAAVGFTPFMLPILVLFWQDCGLDMTEVYWLQTLFAIAVVVLEVPTGMVAGLLGPTRVVRPEVLESAGEFLEGLFNLERVSALGWEALTAFGLFFTNVGHDLSDSALQWIGRELERGQHRRAWETVLTVRTLLHCQASAIAGANLDAFLLVTDLLGEQGADGGFAELTPGENVLRVESTLDAMAGTIRLCGSF